MRVSSIETASAPPGGGSTVTGAAWPRRNVSTVSVTTATQIGVGRADREQAEIGAGQIHQIVDQPRQPPHLRARERDVGRLDRLAGQQLALGELQRHRQRAERVLDLVRRGAEHRGGIVFVIGRRRRRNLTHGRSKMAEIPWPTPMHMLARP